MIKIKSKILKAIKIPVEKFNVNTINSIEILYPKLRQKSKAPTFALTYDGTYHTLMKDIGFSFEEATTIEANYGILYRESKAWKRKELQKAHACGYGTLAFGLKLRCPLYSKSVYDSSSMSNLAASTERTLGNAFTQSYGLLNSRAVNECMDKVYESVYRTSIRPCAQIHDASYYLIKEDSEAVKFLNNTLIKAMSWQELEPIAHDKVKLLANLDIYTFRWKDIKILPNNCDTYHIEEVMKLVNHNY